MVQLKPEFVKEVLEMLNRLEKADEDEEYFDKMCLTLQEALDIIY
jgi:hypothetical protein